MFWLDNAHAWKDKHPADQVGMLAAILEENKIRPVNKLANEKPKLP
jgi:hypothetical protein